jgi:hypothetical protein
MFYFFVPQYVFVKMYQCVELLTSALQNIEINQSVYHSIHLQYYDFVSFARSLIVLTFAVLISEAFDTKKYSVNLLVQ